MPQDKDKVLIRAKDISLLILVLTFFGMIAGPLRKVFILESLIAKVDKIEEVSFQNRTDNAVNKAQYQEISEQLRQINWQLRNMNNNGSRGRERP